MQEYMPLGGLGAAAPCSGEAHGQPPAGGHDSCTFLGWIIGDDDDVAMPMPPGVVMDDDSTFLLDQHRHIPSSSVLVPPHHVVHHSNSNSNSTHAAFPPCLVNNPLTMHHYSPMAMASPPKQQKQKHKTPPPLAAGAGAGLLKPKPEAAPLGTYTYDDSDAAAATAAVDQLAEAARLAEAGDVLGAREILNYLHLPIIPTTGETATPLLRSAFYFKEALRAALLSTTNASTANASVDGDVLLKLGAYKAFSEVCPVLRFAHFTCVQAVLDHLGATACNCIHVLDFDIGVGDQWASLIHELARRRHPGPGPGPGPALKVTALLSNTAAAYHQYHHHHPLELDWELQLVHENLSNFAAENRVPFQLAFFDLDAAMDDPAELLAAGDAVVVHLPAGSVHAAAVPSVLHLVRRLGAKLIVSVEDRSSCDHRGQDLLPALQSCVSLLQSLDAVVGTASDVAANIERFVIQPRIHRCVAERYRRYRAGADADAADKTPSCSWRAMLASAGLVPVQASSLAEAQAESLLSKVPVRGFRVHKRAAGDLVLHWQRGELLSVSAWRC